MHAVIILYGHQFLSNHLFIQTFESLNCIQDVNKSTHTLKSSIINDFFFKSGSFGLDKAIATLYIICISNKKLINVG